MSTKHSQGRSKGRRRDRLRVTEIGLTVGLPEDLHSVSLPILTVSTHPLMRVKLIPGPKGSMKVRCKV